MHNRKHQAQYSHIPSQLISSPIHNILYERNLKPMYKLVTNPIFKSASDPQ